MVQSKTERTLDWDKILKEYGPETQSALRSLLAQHDIDESDPVSALIASMFISQVDSLKAFNTLKDVIENGKTSLAAEFSEQMIALRGIVAIAEDKLVQGSEKTIKERQTEMLNVVSSGIRTAISRANSSSHVRSTSSALFLAGTVGFIALFSVVAGAVMMHAFSVDDDTVGLSERNKAAIEICKENRAELGNKCIIDLD